MHARLGPLERVCHKTVGEAHAIVGYTVEIGSLHVPLVIAAHHLGRMVVGHYVHNVVGLLLLGLFLRRARRQRRRGGNPGEGKKSNPDCSLFM